MITQERPALPAYRYFAWFSLAIILGYAIRDTILAIWIYPVAPTLLDYSGFVFLAVAFLGLCFDSRLRLQTFAILLVASVAVSAVLSPDSATAWIRSILWFGVFAAVGPLVISEKAQVFRNYLWHHSIHVIYALVIGSFVWTALGWPIYGKGAAGITVHCMLLGALAGISTILAFQALMTASFRSLLYWPVFMASALTCLLSGSRSAALAAATGCAVVFIAKLGDTATRIVLTIMVILMATVMWSVLDLGEADDASFQAASLGALTPYTVELVQKGTSNSRTELWASRIAEFGKSPIVGIGVGVELYKKAGTRRLALDTIEPGSTYLAVLSMTGIVGGLSLLLLLMNLGLQVHRNGHAYAANDVVQVAGVGTFWAVHAVAEGWVFAGGSLLCLFFWIWVGRLAHFRYATTTNAARPA